MSDWSYSRHSRNKPRLLGQLKAEYVYLNLCADHSFLSPNRDVIENRLDNRRTGKMRELRESLRQAALINIVAAVNDGDKPEISRFSATSQDDLTNGCNNEIIDFTELVSDSSISGTVTTDPTSYRSTRKQEFVECNGKQRSPRKSKQSILYDKSPIKREISILEGRRIESPPFKTEKKKRRNKKSSEPEEDTYRPELQRSDTNITANKLPNLFPNKNLNTNGLLTTRPCVYEKNESRDISSNGASISLSHFNVRPDDKSLETAPTSKARLLSGSSHESDLSGQDCKENGMIRDSLYISTKEGDIGRSAGFFPPPSSVAKRDITSKKQLHETRPSKCDAVDILDPESGNNDGNFPMVIKSQRDRHGEMGTSLFGLNRNNSLPTISAKLKRQKKRQKREKELISLSTPILRPGAKEQVVLVNGVIGINIKGDDTNGEKTLSVPEELTDITNIPRTDICDSKETVDEFSIYRLAKIDFTQHSGTISLEGQGLPAGRTITETRLQRNFMTFNTNAHTSIAEQIGHPTGGSERLSSCSPESQFDIYSELSRNGCEASRLCIESIPDKPRKYQTITQIRPVLRQPAIINNLSALNSTPRTRPINASLSASKQLEEKRKAQPLSPIMADSIDNDIEEESVDLSICASKVKDTRPNSEKEESAKNKEIRLDNTNFDSSGCSAVGYGRSGSCDSHISSNSGSDYSRQSPLKNIELIRNPSLVAKHQGASSMNPRMDKLTKLQIVTECEQGQHEAAIKILKSFDHDMYSDFTHRKLRKKNHTNHNDNNAKVVTVRVRYSDNDAISETQIDETNYIGDSDNESEIE